MIKQFSKPWKTKGLRISIQTKNWLFQSGDFEKYKYYRNKICFLIRLIKKSYYHELFKNNLNDMRKTWQAVNALLNRRKRNLEPVNKLKDPQSTNNSVINDPLRIPNIMNKYCSSVGYNLATKLPQSGHPYKDYPCNSKSPDTSFFLKPVTSHEVKLEILSIRNNKSSGLYSCPTQLLKRSCDIISPVLANFLNKSVSLGVYPSKLKMSKVIPVYKADDETDACNYRPISLLSNFNRIFEKIMYNRMKVFIQKHQLLSSSQ